VARGVPGLAVVVGVMLAASMAGCGEGGGGSSTEARSTAGSTSSGVTTKTTTAPAATNAEGLPTALGSSHAARSAVEAVLTSRDPGDVCGKYVTQRYLKVAYGGKQGCVQAQQPGSTARSLSSFRIVNSGGQGTIMVASAVPSEGPYDGSKVTISLLFDADHYRVDRLHSNVPVGP
jgi:hypothetical protein